MRLRILSIFMIIFSGALVAAITTSDHTPMLPTDEQISAPTIKQYDHMLHLKVYITNENKEGAYVLMKTEQDGSLCIAGCQETNPNTLNIPLLYWFTDTALPYTHDVVKYELVRVCNDQEPELIAVWNVGQLK